MNLGIRAVLHTARKWKKTLLVFCLLLAITTLVPVSYTHLDVYKRQHRAGTGAGKAAGGLLHLRIP